jgi:small-conductance mechanosensitive channel
MGLAMLPGAVVASTSPTAVLTAAGWFLVAVAAALAVAWLLGALLRLLARRWSLAGELSRRTRFPVRLVLVWVAIWVTLRLTIEPSSWTPGVEQALTILLIASIAWLLVQIVRLIESAVKARFPAEEPDSRHSGRVRTQIQVLRQILEALVVVVAFSVALLTFPGMRAVGASLLASAGLLSIVAGIAAQTSLANLFAGMQIAFSDAIRLDDVVVVEGEWGRIEEITMTYVVVHVWDDRRLILPSTYFTTTAFENWTRRDANLLGTVEFDVDWTVPVDEMRAEMNHLLAETDMWDRRVSVLQVTDAVGGYVRVRILVSAANAPTLFDLRCYLREGLVAWLSQHAEGGLPRMRRQEVEDHLGAEAATSPAGTAGEREGESAATVPERLEPSATATLPPGAPAARGRGTETRLIETFGSDARFFTGTIEAVGRSLPFAGPPRGSGSQATRVGAVPALPSPLPAGPPVSAVPAGRPDGAEAEAGAAPAAGPSDAGDEGGQGAERAAEAAPARVERIPRAVRASELPRFPPPPGGPTRDEGEGTKPDGTSTFRGG